MIPNKLEQDNMIGIITPSDPILPKDINEINMAITLMEISGFVIKFANNSLHNSLGYGLTAKQKAQDINQMFLDKDVKLILCAKGGENSNSTFDYIDFNIIKNNPKIICGYSDSTSLLNMITQKTGLITFHGTTFKSLVSWDTSYTYNEFIKRFKDKDMTLGQEDDLYKTIRPGTTTGKLIGGNLSLISKMVKGKYSLNFKNKILFIEELGLESDPAMVSSNLYYLKQNDIFKNIRGLWIGNYEHSSKIELEKVVLDVLDDDNYNFPIIKSDNFGHTDRKTMIPIGGKAKIDTNEKYKIKLIEDCVI